MIGRRSKILLDATIGPTAVGLMRAVKRLDRKRAANFAGALLRKAGPLLKEHRIGREQLRAAFPEKSDAEIENILGGVWDNLGRVAAEFVHLDEFAIAGEGANGLDVINLPPATRDLARRILGSSQPRLIFASHLANWEIPAVVAKTFGADTAVLYRRPNIAAISDAVITMRAGVMGRMIPTNLSAPVRLAHLLQAGVHVGMLVDQHFTKGVDVTFFGRICKANPLIALLARQVECPIHGMRVVRLAGGNDFWGEMTEAIDPPRDAEGRIDIPGTMQAITSVIESWIRDHPEQWLWLHRRWR
jgi:Kdo2-lipid IVA lauroyltransferase/acyltransferase